MSYWDDADVANEINFEKSVSDTEKRAREEAAKRGIEFTPDLHRRVRLSDEAAAGKKALYESSFKDAVNPPTTILGKFGRYLATLKDKEGMSVEDYLDENLRRTALHEQNMKDNVDRQIYLDWLKQKGGYEDPGFLKTLGYGYGRFFDKALAGSKEIYHENVPNFIENKWESGQALEKLYDEQRDRDEAVNATIGFERPITLGAGEQLPLAMLDLPALVSRGIISGATKTLSNGELAFPALSAGRKSLGGKSLLDYSLKMHPEIAAQYSGREYLPAVFPWLDNLTPKIEGAKNKIATNQNVDRALSIFRDGSVADAPLVAARSTQGIRPGSNEASRFVDNMARGISEGTNPFTMAIREGGKGALIGAADIDQSATEGAFWGAGTGALAKMGAGVVTRPSITSNPYARKMIKQAEELNYPVIDPIRTGDLTAQSTWSAVRNKNPNAAKDIIEKLNSQHNMNVTSLIDDTNPQSSIDKKWLDEQIGVLAKQKQDIADTMAPIDLTPEMHENYLSTQDELLQLRGGRNIDPRIETRPAALGLVDEDGMPISGPEEYVAREGRSALQTSDVKRATKTTLNDINSLFDNGSITSDQYKFHSKRLADQIKATEDPIEKQLLKNASKTLDSVVSQGTGIDTNLFKMLGAKQALAYNLMDDTVVKNGNIIPGKINEFPMFPNLSRYEETAKFVDPEKIRGASLSAMDQISSILGKEKMGWPSLLAGKIFRGTNLQSPAEIASSLYLKPSAGIEGHFVNPFIKPITRTAVFKHGEFGAPEDDFDKRLEEYYKTEGARK